MSRKLLVLAALGIISATCICAQEQQQPQSLGDIARQARKAKEEKEKTSGPPKTVITDDTFSSSHGGALSFAEPANGKAPTSEAALNVERSIARATEMLDRLEPLDKVTLARTLLGSHDVDFPGRAQWEDHLYTAKQRYVSHGRDLIRQVQGLITNAQDLRAAGAKPGDPRIDDLGHHALQLMQDASRTDADFEAIVLQGQDMARRASAQ